MQKTITTSSRKKKKGITSKIIFLVLAGAVLVGVFLLVRSRSQYFNETSISNLPAATLSASFTTPHVQLLKNQDLDGAGKDTESQNAYATNDTITNKATNVVNIKPPPRPTGLNGGPVEQILGMMISASSASGMPPIPMGSEESMLRDFIMAVTNDIVIFDDDDEWTVKFKEQVADFKNELIDVVEQGGSITNALKLYENWINENQHIRRKVTDEYKRLKIEASEEEANAYLAEANRELEAAGIPTVNLGMERKRNRARRDAREAAALKAIEEAQKSKHHNH